MSGLTYAIGNALSEEEFKAFMQQKKARGEVPTVVPHKAGGSIKIPTPEPPAAAPSTSAAPSTAAVPKTSKAKATKAAKASWSDMA